MRAPIVRRRRRTGAALRRVVVVLRRYAIIQFFKLIEVKVVKKFNL
jgi:hypothetical protein